MDTLIGRSLGRYDITAQIGEGGMGVVYRAHDTRLDRDVAVKVLNEAALMHRTRIERFEREARSVARLSHPNILEIHDFGEEDGVIYAVMELLDGEDLRTRLNHGRVELREALGIVRQAADGLAAAHREGIIHRDIKPENLFITLDGRVKILDFGLAHLRNPIESDSYESQTTQGLTKTDTIVGTPRYMSPEQIRGQKVDQTTDLFSLGCVAYELFTGRHPFYQSTKVDTMAAILQHEAVPMADLNPAVPPALDRMILRCLEKKPRDRFQSAHDFGCALQVLGDIRHSSSRMSRQRRSALRPRVIAAALGACVAAVALLALWGHNAASQEHPLPEDLHLGIVPFTVGPDAGDRPLADGLAVSIARSLNRLEADAQRQLWTVEPERIFTTSPETCRSIRTMYNISVCLEGDYDQHEDGFTLTLRLVDPETGFEFRRQTINNSLSNVGALQIDPALAVAHLLELHTHADVARALDEGSTGSPAAYIAYLRGLGLLVRGDAQNALPILQEAVDADALFTDARTALGRASAKRYVETSDDTWFERSSDALSAALAQRPTADAYRALADLLLHHGQPDQAVNALENAFALQPEQAEISKELAAAYRQAGRNGPAIRALQRAIYLRPGYWVYHDQLALLYSSIGEYEAAANQWRQVTLCAPRYAGGFTNLGMVQYYLDNLPAAQKNLEYAIQLAPDTYANAYLNLGTLYFDNARFADAAQMFKKATELNDDSYYTWGNLAFSLVESLQPERADDAFARAIDLARDALKAHPDDPELLADLAGYLAEVDRDAESRECLDRTIELDPADPLILAKIGETYWDLGDRDRAFHWIERAFKAGAPSSPFENRPTLRDLAADPGYQSLKSRFASKIN